MGAKIWVAGVGVVCAVSACGADDETKDPGGGSGGTGATSGSGGSGGSTGGSAGSTGGSAGSTGGSAGSVTDAGIDAEACASDALDCTGFDASSSYDSGTSIVTVVVASNVTPVVSGSAAIQLDCSGPTVAAPVTPNSTGFTIDLSASTPSGDVTPCKPVRFTGKDSCGRDLDFEVQLTYTSEGGMLTLTCPNVSDASTD